MSNEALDTFLWESLIEMERRAVRAEDHGDQIRAGTAAFRIGLERASVTEAKLTSVPVLEHVDTMPVAAAMREIPWAPTPRLDDEGDSVALGLVDKVRDFGDVSCGLMLLGPEAAYPEHRHAPAEIYLPISGDGDWRFGGNEHYRKLGADELVYNNPADLHGAVASTDALLALYVLF